MKLDETTISLLALVVALLSAWYSHRALRQARLMRLFSSFDLANEASIADPEFFYGVHGIDRSIPPEEVKQLAYLSTLLDGYQNYWSDQFDENHLKALDKLKKKSAFLNKILALPANQRRWEILRDRFYGDCDREFIAAIDGLIAHENERSKAK